MTEKEARLFRQKIEKGSQILTDEELIETPYILPSWESLVTKAYEVKEEELPFKFQYNNLPYKAIKSGQVFQAQWVPGLDTASIFVRIQLETEDGTQDTPITASRGMEYEYGKYYLDPEDNNIYLCKRGTESGTITLYYLPHELIGHYFESVN